MFTTIRNISIVEHGFLGYFDAGAAMRSRILLLEIPSALARRLDDPLPQYNIITAALQRPAIHWTDIDQSLLTQAIDIALDIRLRTADCLYVAAAEHLNVPLYT